ncbi:MAG TPA: hypothetical protein VGL99_15370 [Chloroflexota bacterium]|jgi:hypothetical protein
MEKKSLSVFELERQSVLELPDRELLGGTLILVYAPIDLDLDVDVDLKNIANNAFGDADVNVVRVDHNYTDVNVNRNVSDIELTLFCNQIVAVLAAQCLSAKRW